MGRVQAEFRGVLCCPAASFIVSGTDRHRPARRGPQEGVSMGNASVGAGEGSEPWALGSCLFLQTPSQTRLELLRMKRRE